jgi:hypothetical protein
MEPGNAQLQAQLGCKQTFMPLGMERTSTSETESQNARRYPGRFRSSWRSNERRLAPGRWRAFGFHPAGMRPQRYLHLSSGAKEAAIRVLGEAASRGKTGEKVEEQA